MTETTHARRAADLARREAQDADAIARVRAVTAPATRPTGGPLDNPAAAPGQDTGRRERARLAEHYSRPAPKGAA